MLCIAVSVVFSGILFWNSSPDAFAKAMISGTVLPIVLAGPLFFFISIKLRQLSQLNRELHHAATHDGLTQLLNRGAFTRQVNEKIVAMESVTNPHGALLLIDADFFKTINDRWGHAMGDETLRQIAARLVSVTREGDLTGRLGGEEFGVFLPGADLHSASRTAERLRSVIEAMDLKGPAGDRVPISISVGGLYFRDKVDFDQLFQGADKMLYDAKANGRNRVEFEIMTQRRPLESAA